MKARTQILALSISLLAACAPDGPPTDLTPDLETVVDEPSAYGAQEITVEGRVDRALGPCALRLTSGAGWLDTDPVFTVCKTEPPMQERVSDPAPAPGDLVQIVGVPMEMTRVSYERRTTATVDSKLWGGEETMPVLMAESVTVLERAEN